MIFTKNHDKFSFGDYGIKEQYAVPHKNLEELS